MYPKISIITVCLNSEEFIRLSIESVTRQSYKNIEHILIDGGSTDNTISIIEEYRDKIDYFISEADNGISDAMNKGVRAATGDYILFLHSDDYLVDNKALERVAPLLMKRHDICIFPIYLAYNDKICMSQPKKFNWRVNFKGICHQGVFCSRDLFERIGDFSSTYKICMDYDFFLRAYRSGVSVGIFDVPFSVMRMCGLSSMMEWHSLRRRFMEEKKIHFDNCNSIFLRILYILYWPLYMSYRKVISLLSQDIG